MGKVYNSYTTEQLNWLKENHKKYGFKELTKKFNEYFNENRTIAGIKHQVEDKKYMGLKSEKLFTKEEEDFIKKYAPETSRKEFYEMFCNNFGNKRTFNSLNKKAKSLKAYRTKETISRLNKNNQEDRFPIGYIKKVGNCLYIKVKNDLVRERGIKNYMPYHYFVLEENGIKLKKNQCVKFKDNNPLNCKIENLLVISNSTFGYMSKKDLWNKGEITETALLVGSLIDKIKDLE